VSLRTAALLPLAALCGTACTSITIADRDGGTRIERSFGFASVTLHPDTAAVLAEITSLGYHGGPLGIGLGYSRTAIAATPAECRLIVWPRDRDDAARLEQLLGAQPGLCVVAIQPEENKP
jgi:hypothetical protein